MAEKLGRSTFSRGTSSPLVKAVITIVHVLGAVCNISDNPRHATELVICAENARIHTRASSHRG